MKTSVVARENYDVMPSLYVARYRIVLRAEQTLDFPSYAGSAWRGVLGHGLKRSVCVTGLRDCSACMLYRNCAYPYLFETPPPAETEKLRRYPAAPHPFVIEPDHPIVVESGETVQLTCVLVGRGNNQLPLILQALRFAGEAGIGVNRGKFNLEEVFQERQLGQGRWEKIYDNSDTQPRQIITEAILPPLSSEIVRLRIMTPLRVKRDGKLVTENEFAFHDLFRSLLRRLSLLSYFHTESPWELDFEALTRSSRQVLLKQKNLKWQDWVRYSSRQNKKIKMGGIVGEVILDAASIELFWAYLWLGQWVHVGKGAVMGLGKYRLETSAE